MPPTRPLPLPSQVCTKARGRVSQGQIFDFALSLRTLHKPERGLSSTGVEREVSVRLEIVSGKHRAQDMRGIVFCAAVKATALMATWSGTGFNICKRDSLAPFEAEGSVIAALIVQEGFGGWSPVPCQQAAQPHCRPWQVSHLWSLVPEVSSKESLSDLFYICKPPHSGQDPICPMGHESSSALMPVYFNGVAKDSQGASLML